ncbi:signal recognition particle-docking protein FtsY [Geosporobacter ferrireducens]|uniref:Signal recognition particle receptor FtsY n=1 Tax=Geosporobacter ferrireducens TaxID=1424294 RepID=A0A1D8GBV6_9FIRM|nr:signal recognition particle-docking protein FtsY [Geosporobacter ferrireducens]AOT68389.1 signal recognition particle-docking protein FtsY [Geosporobacter ferrireducens]MTI53837.1 signal recognition particle-docking protein FtsY [Geosporobacter ferrireducens]
MFKKILSKLKKDEDKKEEQKLEEIIEAEEIVEDDEVNGEHYIGEDLAEEDLIGEEWQAADSIEEKESPVEIQQAGEEIPEKSGFFARLKEGLTKTRQGIADKVDQVLKTYKKVDDELFEEIEEILITSDVGINTTMKIIEKLKVEAKEKKITEASELKGLLKEILIEILDFGDAHQLGIQPAPAILLIVGVNGVGKTTSIGKIAHRIKSQGKKVLLAAGDTFRAAAIDQLEIWGNRVGVDVIKHQEGADPAAVLFDAIQSAKARKIDVLICDTAGRLHNKKNLMNELGKVSKVLEKEYGDATKDILLVLDATTGQNAIQQAKTFKEVVDINGIILTKLDGTAKGGVVLAISSELNVPVKLIGVGEGMNDLQVFEPRAFVNALFGDDV